MLSVGLFCRFSIRVVCSVVCCWRVSRLFEVVFKSSLLEASDWVSWWTVASRSETLVLWVARSVVRVLLSVLRPSISV